MNDTVKTHLENHWSSGTLAALAVLLMIGFSIPGRAQIVNRVTAAQEVNPNSEHQYIGVGGESVNPADGSLTFDLPIQPPPGRQLSLPFRIRYSSPLSMYVTNTHPWSEPYDNSSIFWSLPQNRQKGYIFQVDGWDYMLPSLTFTVEKYADFWQTCADGSAQEAAIWASTNYIFRGLDGVQRALSNSTLYMDNNFPGCSGNPPLSQPVVNTTESIHGVVGTMPFYSDFHGGEAPLRVIDSSGTVYPFAKMGFLGDQPGNPVEFTFPASPIIDRNGNRIIYNSNSSGYSDTLGRNVLSWTGPGKDGDQISMAGLGGNITVHWKSLTFTANLTGTLSSEGGTCSLTPAQLTISGISEIDLPNGQKYQFLYDSNYGRVNKIIFPDGGYVRYVWNLNPTAKLAAIVYEVYAPTGLNAIGYFNTVSCDVVYDEPAITDRYVSYDGTNEVLHQKFTYTTNGFNGQSLFQWTSKRTDVVATDLVSGQTSTTTYHYAGVGADPSGIATFSSQSNQIPVETEVDVQDSTTTKTVYKTWLNYATVTAEQTSLTPGQATTTVRCYDSNEQVTAVYEYGLPSESPQGASASALPSCYAGGAGQIQSSLLGPLKRVTQTTYHPFFEGFPTDSSQVGYGDNNEALILGTHIVNAPDSVTVQDESGNTVQQTQYAYTDVATSSGTAVGLVSPPGPNRGNILNVKRWRSSDKSWPTTSYTYYDTGQAASQTDACGNGGCADMTGTNHKTTYSYTDSYNSCGGSAPPQGQTNGYITGVTYSNGSTKSFCWGYEEGRLLSATDENEQITKYQYNDPGLLGRITNVDRPGGGRTVYSYNDGTYDASTNTPSVTTTTEMNGSTNLVTIAARDGMWHTVRTILSSDPDGADIVDTTYNGTGLVASVTNPYRSTTTPLKTTYQYDVLGRQSLLTHPDGASIQVQYSGYCTTVKDENGHLRKSCVDGLGRLVQVLEPNPATGLLSSGALTTDYAYDVLGNLLSVTQNGASGGTPRVRTFTYDSLSQLLCASNPENSTASCPSSATSTAVAGTTWYAYDANGNVKTKTDARGIVTTYAYDALNRLLSKSYSDSSTPRSCYQYDSSSVTNGIGRLSASWTQAASVGSCAATAPTSGFITKRALVSYDAMGRLLSEKQYTPAGVATGVTYAPSYTYDLTGNLLTSTDGVTALPTSASTLLTFTRTYDAAARLATVTSNWMDATHPASIFAAQTIANTSCSSATGSTFPYAAFGGLQNAAFGGGVLTVNRSYDNRLRLSCEHDIGGINSPATAGSATVTITGTEQTK